MADTVTPKLSLVKPEVGASPDSWGNKTNNNWDKIDASMVRQTKQWTISMGDDTVGSVAGPWELTRYGNDELPIDNPISVNRQTGAVSIPGGIASPIKFPYQAAPPSPPAGSAVIYFDVNGNPVIKRPDGTVMHLGLAPGMITYTGASTPDAGCAFLNGQAISRVDNPVLFTRYGTLFGAGDGVTTFNLPDAKGSIFAHPDQGAGRLTANAYGLGVAPLLGNRGGLEYNILTVSAIPTHSHQAVMYDPTHTHGVSHNAAQLTNSTTPGGGFLINGYASASISINYGATGNRINSSNGLDYTYHTGGGGAHSSVQSTLIMNAQIKLG